MASTTKKIGQWFATVGESVIDFASGWIPGVDRLADTIKRTYKGDPVLAEEAIDKATKLLSDLYAKLYGSQPTAPDDLKLLTAQNYQNKVQGLKNQARGSLAARHVVEKELQKANKGLKSAQDEYSAALKQYDKDSKQFAIKTAQAQILADKITRAGNGEAGWNLKDSLKGYEKNVQEF